MYNIQHCINFIVSENKPLSISISCLIAFTGTLYINLLTHFRYNFSSHLFHSSIFSIHISFNSCEEIVSYLCLYNDPEIDRHSFCPLKCNLKTTIGTLTTTEAGTYVYWPIPLLPPSLPPPPSFWGDECSRWPISSTAVYRVPRYFFTVHTVVETCSTTQP